MKEQIQIILLNSNEPAQDICELMKKQTQKNTLHFAIFVFLLNIGFVYILHSNKPSNEQIYNICRPIVDTMQKRYQTKLDFIVDSLETDYYTRQVKSKRK